MGSRSGESRTLSKFFPHVCSLLHGWLFEDFAADEVCMDRDWRIFIA